MASTTQAQFSASQPSINGVENRVALPDASKALTSLIHSVNELASRQDYQQISRTLDENSALQTRLKAQQNVNSELSIRVSSLEADVSGQKDQIGKLNDQYGILRARSRQLEDASRDSRENAEKAERAMETLETTLKKRDLSLKAFKQKEDAAKRRIVELEQELASSQAAKTSIETALNATQERLEELEGFTISYVEEDVRVS